MQLKHHYTNEPIRIYRSKQFTFHLNACRTKTKQMYRGKTHVTITRTVSMVAGSLVASTVNM